MKLEPDLELLDSIGIINPFHQYTKPRGYQMEVEAEAFNSLSPFLTHWGGGEALQELFFYQLNFVPKCEPPQPHTIDAIRKDKAYFQSRDKLLKMDFSHLERITLNFGKGLNEDLPSDLLKYFGHWIKAELDSEKPADISANDKLQELKVIEKQLTDSKLKIQNALPAVESIIKAKSQQAVFTRKQIILCTYGIFYQRGHRLNFDDHRGTELESPVKSFRHVDVYDILKK